MKIFWGLILVFCTFVTQAQEVTSWGKIVGIDTRDWGLHVQTEFGGGGSLECPVTPGSSYMFDFILENANRTGGNAEFTQSLLLAAFASGAQVSFLIYDCNGPRPIIGFIRVKK